MNDPINPEHYDGDACMKAIEAMRPTGVQGADFCRGQVVKYLWRINRKDDPIQEAEKALWYLTRLVEEFKNDKLSNAAASHPKSRRSP